MNIYFAVWTVSTFSMTTKNKFIAALLVARDWADVVIVVRSYAEVVIFARD